MKTSTLVFGIVTVLCLALTSCSANKSATGTAVRGGVSGIVTIDSIITKTHALRTNRSAALLGLYVAEYLTNVPRAQAADSALLGIGAQMQIFLGQSTIQDPDYELIQAFGDALAVDVPDLLNRSLQRNESLDTYTEALTNIATRANDRYKELQSSLTETQTLAREQSKERSAADRDLQKAIRDKNFSEAADKQKALNDIQAQFAETDLKQKQLGNLVNTLDTLLQLYGKKIMAIQSNREALIAGIKVVDIPGVEELNVLEKQKGTSRSGQGYDSLFQ